MNYEWHYNKLIETRTHRVLEDCQIYEIHHVVPKSMGGDDSNENMIKLTPREHFLAHWLLWRIHRNREMSFAFFSMCQYRKGNRKQFKISSRAYEEARLSRKTVGVSDETRKKMSEAKRGKIYSEETKKRMSIAKRGSSPWNKGMIGVSSETRERMSLGAQKKQRKHLDYFRKIYKEHSRMCSEFHLKILEMYVKGYTNREISQSLEIKDYDIKNVLRTIKNKFAKHDSEQ
jgi:ATP/maltotriose-dependent transcriptional regulator MalT